MEPLKPLVAVVMSIGLGIGVLYCVTHVGELNREAAVIEACINQPQSEIKPPSCPDRPASQAEVKSLQATANTLGNIGWIAFFLLVFGFGSTVYDFITD